MHISIYIYTYIYILYLIYYRHYIHITYMYIYIYCCGPEAGSGLKVWTWDLGSWNCIARFFPRPSQSRHTNSYRIKQKQTTHHSQLLGIQHNVIFIYIYIHLVLFFLPCGNHLLLCTRAFQYSKCDVLLDVWVWDMFRTGVGSKNSLPGPSAQLTTVHRGPR